MKRQILLLAITAAALSSCTTAYKTGQTPDDVYFSPARPQDEYVQVKEKDEYRYDDEYYDDRYLRMKVQNRSRWDYLDDWYAYDRYGIRYDQYYGGYSYYSNYYNPYTSWNYYYNPYCRNKVIYYNPKQSYSAVNVQKPRSFNLASYTNTNYNNANNSIRMNSVKAGVVSKPVYNNSNSGRSFSNTVKDIFRGNNDSYTPSRNYSPSNSGSSGSRSSGSSGSSSGSSSGGATRPTRGGN
jgi:hypothetical protein